MRDLLKTYGIPILLLLSTTLFVVWFAARSCSIQIEPPPTAKKLPRKKVSKGIDSSSVAFIERRALEEKLHALSSKNKSLSRLLDDLRKKKREIVTITKTVVKVQEKIAYKKVKSTKKKGNVETLVLRSKAGLLIAAVSFDRRNEKRPWSYELYSLRLKLRIFHSVNKRGMDKVGITAALIDKDGKEARPSIIDNKTVYSFPDSKVKRLRLKLNPLKIEAYGLAGASDARPSIGVGVASHLLVLQKEDDIFRFIGLMLSFSSDNTISVSVMPISFNIGSVVPFMEDFYLTSSFGMGYSINTSRIAFIWFLGLGTTL